MKEKQNLIVYIAVVVLTILFIIVGNQVTKFTATENYVDDYFKAKIVAIESSNTDEMIIEGMPDPLRTTTIEFSAEILSGDLKGEVVNATQTYDNMTSIQPEEVQINDKILMHEQAQMDGSTGVYIFADYLRSDNLIGLVMLFLVLIVLFGRFKGVSTVISLAATCLILFMVYVPGIIKGYNIYMLTTVVSTYIIFMNLILINGLSKKTWCAIFGNVSGVVAAGIVTILMTNALRLTGFVDTDSGMLISINPENPIDLIAVMWASVIIGSLGAIMDIAMTIASALQEVSEHMHVKNFKRLFDSGMNIGRDAVGTMTNTLILAYIGSALTTVLLLVSSNKNILLLFNLEMIAMEILQGVVGSIGILLAIPLTSVISAYLYSRE